MAKCTMLCRAVARPLFTDIPPQSHPRWGFSTLRPALPLNEGVDRSQGLSAGPGPHSVTPSTTVEHLLYARPCAGHTGGCAGSLPTPDPLRLCIVCWNGLLTGCAWFLVSVMRWDYLSGQGGCKMKGRKYLLLLRVVSTLRLLPAFQARMGQRA